tara:strand:- start:1837 stop:2832 length:996 start_codon:yes stop_codon:yes gene_type:complete
MSIFNNNFFKGIFGTSISLFCFFIFFNKIDDLGKVIEIVTSVDFFIILFGFFIYFFSIYFRTLRWNSIFENKIKIKLTSLSRIVISGYMFNNLLPARLGELARIYHFNLVKRIDKSYLLGTILAERITDVIALFIFIGAGIFFVPKDLLINLSDELGVNINLIYLFLILIGLSIVFFVLMQFKTYRKIMTAFIPKFNFINDKILSIVDSFFKGLFNLEKNKIINIIFLALIIWIIEFSMFFIVETQIELNLDNTFLAIVFFGVFANLSGIVPSTSGGWGPFELIGTIVLISFGADRESAAAFTIIVHLILWLPISIIGLICFLYDLKGRKT